MYVKEIVIFRQEELVFSYLLNIYILNLIPTYSFFKTAKFVKSEA